MTLPAQFMGLPAGTPWILLLFLYAGIASMLPVWLLLQPRDYINGIQLFLGDVVSQRSRTLFMIVIFLLLLMVNAVFGARDRLVPVDA